MSQSEKEHLLRAATVSSGEVTLSASEARCARAFDAWISEWEIRPLHRMLLWNGWQACWRHLEKQVFSEFIER